MFSSKKQPKILEGDVVENVAVIQNVGDTTQQATDRRGYQSWTAGLPEGRIKAVLVKLFTNEDHLQLHKFLGIMSLISFMYRYFYVYPTTGTLGFDGSWFDHATIACHILLSTSSLIFHVIARRLMGRPMIIWEEYRLHAIVFSTRCMSVYLLGILRPFQDMPLLERIMVPAVVLTHHVVADWITARYGSKDGSTTVRMKDQHTPEIKSVLRFYAFYQFSALASHLQPHARLADLGFNTFIAIQSSAFLMTLYRKGLVSEVSHAMWYTFCLLVSMFHIFRNCGNALFLAKLTAAYVLRTEFRMNKYLLWAGFAVVSVPAVVEVLGGGMVDLVGDSINTNITESLNWASEQSDVLGRFISLSAEL
eukprot:CAMPEP_0181315448 /NCGR_PEP_ID=MMETSP1101-20121128/15384_1 /TAXON_ID=46948 /ORGANISM="Rhodomonas abbreviata, Strain Caron Lab Isolate" /LENGTH=363 /DNA_ID=CAMNT_0023422663 /DNA_START=35 /DNA_END=1126 /DNA_ORIENTATION=-